MRRDPAAAESRRIAERVLAGIEGRVAKRKPRRADLEAIAADARLFATLGLGERARAVLRRGRAAGLGGERVAVAEAVLALALDPASASARLRALATRDPATAAWEAVHAALRGDLRGAIALAERHDGFAGVPAATDALGYVVLALALEERIAEADALLARWRKRHRRAAPALEVALLRAEALADAYANRHADELRRLEDAEALSEEHGLGEAGAFARLARAVAQARLGDLERAAAIVAAWPPAAREPTTLDVYADLARLEIAVLADRPGEAEAIARRVLPFAERTGNAMLLALIRFALVLSTGAAAFPEAHAAYAALVHRHPSAYHQRRLRVVEGRIAAGARTMRDARLLERSRIGAAPVPLARAWNPSAAALAADLYVDRVDGGGVGTIRVRGGPAARLDERPVLARVLVAVLDAPGWAAPMAELYERVWQTRWDPLRHEAKCHVTLHRLRAWLAELGAGDARYVELVDGVIRLAPGLDVRVLEAPSG